MTEDIAGRFPIVWSKFHAWRKVIIADSDIAKETRRKLEMEYYESVVRQQQQATQFNLRYGIPLNYSIIGGIFR
jgi:hypothetical protein